MARKWKIPLFAVALLVLAGAGYVAYIYVKAGELKSIAPHFAGTCRRVDGAVGAEDITIHSDGGIAYISSDDRRATQAGRPVPGAIFAYDLRAAQPTPRNLTPDADKSFHPHGIALWVAPDGRKLLFVVNHPGSSLFGDNRASGPLHTIEIFEQTGDGPLVRRRRLDDPMLVSPNDIAPVGEDRFYVTNDHGSPPGFGRTLEEYLRLERANVVYFDGERFREVAGGLRYANGIAVSRSGAQVFVATVTSFAIAIYDRDESSGALTPTGEIDLGTGPDNIELDAAGNLWVAAHPKLLSFVSHAEDRTQLSPSQVIRIAPGEDGRFGVTEIFLGRGDDLSGSSVAARGAGRLLIGSVFEPHFLDCSLGD